MRRLSSEQLQAAVTRMADKIMAECELANVIFIGIHTGGYPLARRIQRQVESATGTTIPVGALDIALYRDDLATSRHIPYVRQSEILFDLNKKHVILVDDVLFSGRTIRAALSAILDIGRPAKIELAVLIDRGHRELPIAASIVGETLPTRQNEHVKVHLSEIDGRDEVVVN